MKLYFQRNLNFIILLRIILMSISYLSMKIGSVMILLTYIGSNWKKNQIFLDYKQNKKNQKIIDQCPSLKKYNPTIYLNGFLHTVLASYLPKDGSIKTIKENINDTGISIDWASKDQANNKLLFILPGLTGKATDSYINALIKEAREKGFTNICIYNYRLFSKDANLFFVPDCQDYGLELTPNTFSPDFKEQQGMDKDYHFFQEDIISGKRPRVDLIADLHYTLTYLQNKYKFESIMSIGCSYGGLQMCNYLGRFKEKALIKAAVSVGPAYSMFISTFWITRTMDFIISYILKNKIASIRQIYDKGNYPPEWDINVDRVLKTYTVREFDQHLAIKVYGYKSVDAYYRHFSPVNKIGNIKIPLLCISSRDDSVCHWKSLCKDEILLNENAIICETALGGHIGFVEGIIPKNTWFPKPAIEFLLATQ